MNEAHNLGYRESGSVSSLDGSDTDETKELEEDFKNLKQKYLSNKH